MKKTKGSIMLLFAAFFWGTTFVAQTTASDQIGTFTFNGSRSIVGAAFLALLILARTGMKKQKAKVSGEPVEKESIKRTVIGGILCGCVLFFATNLQQSGIAAYPEGVASSGRSGFLTATYVVMVAIVSGLLGKKLHKIVYVAVFVPWWYVHAVHVRRYRQSVFWRSAWASVRSLLHRTYPGGRSF